MTNEEKNRFVAENTCGAVEVHGEDWQLSTKDGAVYLYHGNPWVRGYKNIDDDKPFNPCESLDDCAIAEACIRTLSLDGAGGGNWQGDGKAIREYTRRLHNQVTTNEGDREWDTLHFLACASPMQRVDAMIRAYGGEP